MTKCNKSRCGTAPHGVILCHKGNAKSAFKYISMLQDCPYKARFGIKVQKTITTYFHLTKVRFDGNVAQIL